MISEIRIQNFKSIQDLTLKPGRVTVLIGENGSGKSNILEGIAFAAAASAKKLDNEFLFNRGIRVTEAAWMRSAFAKEANDSDAEDIQISMLGGDASIAFSCRVSTSLDEEGEFEGWKVWGAVAQDEVNAALHDPAFVKGLVKQHGDIPFHSASGNEFYDSPSVRAYVFAHATLMIQRTDELNAQAQAINLKDFLIFAPENTVLRSPPVEGAIQPLGTKGEGLFRLLQTFADPKSADSLADLKESLRLFGWFEDFLTPDESATAQARLQIRDRWLAPERAVFDQRSANEGFLYVLFYLTLVISSRTPRFFAIDNLDNALNPKLCATLMRQLAELAKKYGKQILCTTHNPAILDGLDLKDDEQRLFTVRRDSEGRTVVNRVRPPQPRPGEAPLKLAQALLSGLIGGLPDNF